MKRLFVLVVLVALFGAAASAFACDSCDTTNTFQQKIQVNVPTVLKFVYDANTTKTGLPDWSINLQPGQVSYTDCYVVPNWVNGSNLQQWLDNVMNDTGVLLPANPSWGYPPIVQNGSHQVLTWAQVAAWYKASHPDAPLASMYTSTTTRQDAMAKGNLLCKNAYAFEVYTNCTNASLSFSLNPHNSSDTGFGWLHYHNVITVNGVDGTFKDKTFDFTTADGNARTLIGTLTRGLFYDNNVNQWLWLGDSSHGSYNLRGVYTLGDPVS